MEWLADTWNWQTFLPSLTATASGVFLALLLQSGRTRRIERKRRSNLRALLVANLTDHQEMADLLLTRKPWHGSLFETFDTTVLKVAAHEYYFVADNLELQRQIDEARIQLESIDRFYLKPVMSMSWTEDERKFMEYRADKLPKELKKAKILIHAVLPSLEETS